MNIELTSAEFAMVIHSLEWYLEDYCVFAHERRPYKDLIAKLVEISEREKWAEQK